MAVRTAALVDLAGLRVVARSSFRPLAIWFSSSTWVRRRLVVVQACKKVSSARDVACLPGCHGRWWGALARRKPEL